MPVFRQIAQSDDGIDVISKIVHVSFKHIGVGVHPGMLKGGHTMERQDGDFSVPSLFNRPDKIIEGPVWASSSSRRSEQGMVLRRIIRRTGPPSEWYGNSGATPRRAKRKLLSMSVFTASDPLL